MGIKKQLLILTLVLASGSTVRALEKPIDFPKGWSLNNGVRSIKNIEFKVITDSKGGWDPQTAIWRGDTYAFVRGHLMSEQFAVSAGDELEISFYAKDPDGKDVSCKIYAYSRLGNGSLRYSGDLTGFSHKAVADWIVVSGTIIIPEKLPSSNKTVDAVIVVLASDTGAYFDYPTISHIKKGEFSNPEYARYEGTGRAKLAREDYAGAREAFHNALKCASTEDEKKLVQSQIKETDKMERISTTAEKSKTAFKKADALVKQGKYADARKEYEGIKKASGMDYMKEISLCNIAKLYCMEKDYANVHKTYGEIFALPGLTAYYIIYGLFQEADAYIEQKNYNRARKLYEEITKTSGASAHHVFTARLKIGDTYRMQQQYSRARDVYEDLLKEQETSSYPHEGYRLDLRDRLEEIDGLADGTAEKSIQQKRIEWVNNPKYSIYVSLEGKDNNPGTKEKPFATIARAQEEARKIKSGKGMPEGGIAVYLRSGKYFITESITFEKEDSGTADAPIVYRSYPGEEVRIIGGRQVTNFKPLADPDILRRLPEESKRKVWVVDLAEKAGINDYGQLMNRGSYIKSNPAALELFFNGRVMQLARWPNKGWVKVAGIEPDGERRGRGEYQMGGFQYAGDRPKRWTEEKDAWLDGYWYLPYDATHAKLKSIDTEKRTISLFPDTRWNQSSYLHRYKIQVSKNMPYYAYNLLSELDVPGEWYLDRDTGRLYFYPPDKIQSSEVIVSTLDAPLITMKDVSNIVLCGLTLEVTRRDGVTMEGGINNLIAKSIIRNTGQWAVKIENGWEHGVVGCDIYDTGEGGVSLNPDPVVGNYEVIPGRKELIPARNVVENNHIYRFNRFDGGYRQAVSVDGVGQRVSHNLMNDSPMQAICFNANDHVIEFNELHDVLHSGRELGAIYVYGEPWYMMSRGTVIRNNFFHHISGNSSPNFQQQAFGLVLDCINSGIVMENNIFYRVPKCILEPGPDNRIENNIFIDSVQAIQLNNMWTLFNNTATKEPIAYRISRLAEERLEVVRYKQPPWSYRYPQMVNILSDKTPVGWAKGNTVKRNINTGGRFMTFGGVRDDVDFENNLTLEHPLFIDRDNMNFSIRQGAPAYGLTGFEPLPPMEEIGVYQDELRASWPVNRAKEDIGRYYYNKPSWAADNTSGKRIAPPLTYYIPARKSSIVIDGELKKEEWAGLDTKNAMVIERYYTDADIKGPKSYAWLLHDNEYLYMAVMHEADPYKEDMSAGMKQHMPSVEIAIESMKGPHSQGWWFDDGITAGPVYSMTWTYKGGFKLNNLFGMPDKKAKDFEEAVEYKTAVQDDGNRVWTSEMKISLEKIGINPSDVDRLAFNIGIFKRGGWFAWVPPGGSIWKIENAGLIEFER